MEAALWVAKTGLDAQQTRMTVIANNLANVNTKGFKRDRATFEDLLYQSVRQGGAQTSADTTAPTGLLLGTGTQCSSPQNTCSREATLRAFSSAAILSLQAQLGLLPCSPLVRARRSSLSARRPRAPSKLAAACAHPGATCSTE